MAALRRRVVALGAVLLASIAASLGLLEVAVRALGLAPDVHPIWVSVERSMYRRSDDPVLGYELQPNWRDPAADGILSYPFVNSHGFRDVERGLERRGGVQRIVVLGDSVVAGERVLDLEDTIPRRLERLFPGTVEVLNLGVPGYCTRAEVEVLRTGLDELQPDVVVLVFVRNDFDNFNNSALRGGTPLPRPAIVKHLFVRSALFRLTCLRFDLWRFREETDPLAVHRAAIGDDNVVEGLRLLATLEREHAFRVLIAIWPAFTDDAVEDGPFMDGDPGQLLVEAVATHVGLETERLSEAFVADCRRQEPCRPRTRYTVGDGMHPSGEGASIAAKAIRDRLAIVDATPSSAAIPSDGLRNAARAHARAAPNASALHYDQALALSAEGRLAEAEQEYRSALELDAHSWQARANLAVLLWRAGRRDEALAQIDRAARSAPDNADVQFNRASMLAESGLVEPSTAAFRQCLRLDPAHVGAHLRLGILLRRVGRVQEGEAEIAAARRLIPTLMEPTAP